MKPIVIECPESTSMRNNHEALDRWAIVPRMLRDTSQRILGIDLLGRALPAPVLVALVGAGQSECGRAHRRSLRRGRRAYIFSNQGSAPMEDTAAA